MNPAPDDAPLLFRFDGFEADPRTGELRRDGDRVPIQDVPFRFLVALLERPGRLVTREELRARIWPTEVRLDFENALGTAARKVRRTLGDSSRTPLYLETLPGRGYRFARKVEAIRTRERRPGRLFLAGAGLLVLTLGAARLFGPGPKPAPFEDRCVAVAPFENLTGDPALQSLGRQVADLVRLDLQQVDDVKVAAEPGLPAEGGDSVRRLAEATKAHYVAAGIYYLRGGELQFQARVVDPWTERVVYAVGPFRTPKGAPASAFPDLRQELDGAIAWTCDETWSFPPGTTRPSRLEALMACRQGEALEGRDDAAGIKGFERALALDPGFLRARWRLFRALARQGQDAEARTHLVRMEADYALLPPVERALVRWARADLEARPLGALEALDDLRALGAEPAWVRADRGVLELGLNRVGSAVRSLADLPAGSLGEGGPRSWGQVRALGSAHHMARAFVRQLAVAREGAARFPDVLDFPAQELEALAALGRLKAFERARQALPAVAPRPGSLAQARALLQGAVELRAHGHLEASRRAAEDLLARLRTRPDRQVQAAALVLLDRGDEALPLTRALAAEAPGDVELQGTLGALLARLGRVAEARAVEAALAADARPRLQGEATYGRARVAAQLGERDRAVELLAQAFGQGYRFSPDLHRDPFLEPLRGLPAYEALVKPGA